MASNTYHEPLDLLSEDTRTMHRAIVSLMEELEAVDWYQQRADACPDAQLKDVLLHNKNEEIEHASMVLEWIRRHNEHFDQMLRRYLFSEAPITGIEKAAEANAAGAAPAAALGIGSMKKGR
jgi:ferritin-like protein